MIRTRATGVTISWAQDWNSSHPVRRTRAPRATRGTRHRAARTTAATNHRPIRFRSRPRPTENPAHERGPSAKGGCRPDPTARCSMRPSVRWAATMIRTPPPSRMVLACRCGRMLDLADMHRLQHRDRPEQRAGALIEPITCATCAGNGVRARDVSRSAHSRRAFDYGSRAVTDRQTGQGVTALSPRTPPRHGLGE